MDLKCVFSLLVLSFVDTIFGLEDAATLNRDAKILASKFLLSRYAVEHKEFAVDYHVYNVGDKMANRITLLDNNFPSDKFEIVKGFLTVTWDKLAPGANVSNSVILKPIQFGVMNITAAQVTYYPSETAEKPRVGYTTSLGEYYIYRLKDYERKFASKYFDWLMFFAMLLPTIGLPFFLWSNSKKKYDALMAKESKNSKKD